jgi:hypothetical protein
MCQPFNPSLPHLEDPAYIGNAALTQGACHPNSFSAKNEWSVDNQSSYDAFLEGGKDISP